MVEGELFKQIVAGGTTAAVMLVLALLALRHVYNALIAEKNFRIEDAQKFNTLALAMQKEIILATQSLVKIADAFEKREERLEREFRELTLRQSTPNAPFTPRRAFGSKVDPDEGGDGG